MASNKYFLDSIEKFVFALHLSRVYLTFDLEIKINKLPYQNLDSYLNRMIRNIHKENYTSFLEYCKDIYQKHLEHKINNIYFFDENYPALLKHIPKPPLVLFAQGKMELLQKQLKISMVGTRNPSNLSICASKFLANFLSNLNICIVSGMAIGIDSVCHRQSIHSIGGSIAVLAHGLNHVYPEKNYDLFLKLKELNLLLLSEYPIGCKPTRYSFPQRNRIISGLSKILFYMEGGIKSGALITVRYALDQGREVYVFTHSMLRNNQGGESILQDGAYSVLDFLNIKIKESNGRISIAPNSFYIGQNKWATLSLEASLLKKKLLEDLKM